MRATQIAFVLTLAALLGPAEARADIYQCRGENGVIHFTNVRVPGQRCTVAVRESGSSSSSSASSSSSRASTPRRPRAARAPADPNRYRAFDAFIQEAARTYQLPEAFIRAVIRVESDYNPTVVSHAGAMGLMQLMPRTARSMGVQDAFDPRQNILGGTRYLRILANKFNGDLVLTVAAYNAGEGAVMRYRGVPPYAETRRYVQRVLRHYYAFRSGQVLASR